MISFDRLPIVGPCKAFRPPGHAPHVVDIIGLGEQQLRPVNESLWRGLGSLAVERFAGWGRPLVAPADSTVVSVHDGESDHSTVSYLRDVPLVLFLRPLRFGKVLNAMAGNYVVLDIAGGFILLAHLRHDSIVVAEGDTVTSGEQIGDVGNSGNSLVPHVHVQAMTSADPYTAAILPWQVTTLERHVDKGWQSTPGPVPLRTAIRTTD